MGVRYRISGALRAALRRLLGRDLVRIDADHSPDQRLARFLRDSQIDLVLDVGANIGQTGEHLREIGYSGRIVSFEPLSGPFAALQTAARATTAWDCINTAIGEIEGQATINVSGTSVSSSFLPMAERHTREVPESSYVATETVKVMTLDAVFPTVVGTARNVFLKVDVQGSEMPVLRGAVATLPRLTLVELELMPAQLYEGQSKYFDLLALMDRSGFDLVWIEPVFSDRKTGDVLALDALMRRRVVDAG